MQFFVFSISENVYDNIFCIKSVDLSYEMCYNVFILVCCYLHRKKTYVIIVYIITERIVIL